MPDASAAQALVAAAQSADLIGPILVVSTSDVVGRFAPAWAKALVDQGFRYRVLVVDPGCPLAADDIASEAASLLAKGILVVGNSNIINTATVAAQRSGLPLAMLAQN